jgi:hypothetical protein
VLPAPELAHRVGRYWRDHVGRRTLDVCGNELGSKHGGSAEPVLLPRADECAGRPPVGDRRPRLPKSEPASRTFAALVHRPYGGSAAAGTERRVERPQLEQTGRAEQIGRAATGDAGTREEKIDEPRPER